MQEPIFGKPRTLLSPNIHAPEGSFALDQTPLYFEHCRERFATKFGPDTPGFYFKHAHRKGDDVVRFMCKTELILGIQETTQYSRTNRDSIVYVQPGFFWRKCAMRRSLLTILLRSANGYDATKDNYEDALFSNPYALATKPAILRFFCGFAQYTGQHDRGWKGTFEKLPSHMIKSLLINQGSATTPELSKFLWI